MIRGRFSRGGRDDRESDAATEEEEPLFNLDEIYERRILAWSPEPEDELAPDEAQLDDEPVDVGEPVERVPSVDALVAAAPAVDAAAPAEPAAEERELDQPAPARRRGRPRGRPRRQVHFHVDPDEERLLMKAVERFGSQQKALVAALESLDETERLRLEIEDLKSESERQRELLAKAESLFARG